MIKKMVLLCVLVAIPAYAAVQTLQADAVNVGNGVAIVVTPHSTLAVEVTISDTASVIFEVSKDRGQTWHKLECASVRSGSRTHATALGDLYVCDMREYSQFRARIDSYTAGYVTVHARQTRDRSSR